MTPSHGRLKLFLGGLLAWGLGAGPGRLKAEEPPAYPGQGGLHPLQVHPQEHAALAGALPPLCREQLHVFFVNGLDPAGYANLAALSGYVKAQGYLHTYYYQLRSSAQLTGRVRQIHQQDPQARFALVGFSAGTYVVRGSAHSLREEGITVDLLVYIGGDMILNTPYSRPANVCRVLNITGHGFLLSGGDLLFNGDEIDGARNLRLPCRHMLLPSRRETIDALMQELTAAAAARPTAGSP
jgi:hypothetical protein